MIKYLKVSVVSLVILLSMFVGGTEALAWDDCPFGLVDDPYPGECSRYVDTDNDGLCDHSQLAPEDRVDTAAVETEEEVPVVEPVEDAGNIEEEEDEALVNINTENPTNSINTNVSNADDNIITETEEQVVVEDEKDRSQLIKGLIAIFLPLIAILGYVIWQKKKLK